MKTYKHNRDQSIALHAEFDRRASEIHERLSWGWFAEVQLLELEHIGKYGLPDCYTHIDEFLADFWADFPWSNEGIIAVVELKLLKDSRFPAIAAAVKESIGLDLEKELKEGITHARNDEETHNE